MKNVRLIKKPNLTYLSLIILFSFIFLSCGPENEKYEPIEHEEDTSILTIVTSATYLDKDMCSLQNVECHIFKT